MSSPISLSPAGQAFAMGALTDEEFKAVTDGEVLPQDLAMIARALDDRESELNHARATTLVAGERCDDAARSARELGDRLEKTRRKADSAEARGDYAKAKDLRELVVTLALDVRRADGARHVALEAYVRADDAREVAYQRFNAVSNAFDNAAAEKVGAQEIASSRFEDRFDRLG